jgi:hypothetical protein
MLSLAFFLFLFFFFLYFLIFFQGISKLNRRTKMLLVGNLPHTFSREGRGKMVKQAQAKHKHNGNTSTFFGEGRGKMVKQAQAEAEAQAQVEHT